MCTLFCLGYLYTFHSTLISVFACVTASLEMLQNEVVLAKSGIEKEAELGDQRLTQHKMTWLDEKTQLERRLDDLEGKLKQAQKQREDTTHAHAKVSTEFVRSVLFSNFQSTNDIKLQAQFSTNFKRCS